MIDEAFWYIGVATAASGSVGIVSLAVIWSLNVFFRLTGFSRVLYKVYGEILKREWDARRVPG